MVRPGGPEIHSLSDGGFGDVEGKRVLFVDELRERLPESLPLFRVIALYAQTCTGFPSARLRGNRFGG